MVTTLLLGLPLTPIALILLFCVQAIPLVAPRLMGNGIAGGREARLA
jgi:hypothetical protein